MPIDTQGLRIHYFRDLWIFRQIAMNRDIPFDTQKFCPACNAPLRVFCTLIAKEDTRRMRLGSCSRCGYVGYMDRPTKEWMLKFYREEWDEAKIRDAKAEAKKLKHKLSGAQRTAVHLAEGSAVDKDRPLCEIGCGNGAALKEFQDLGFTKLIGIENSRYRSELTKACYGYEILTGNFESAEVIQKLRSQAPIALFFSYHVFEHIYHPEEAIKTASQLQGNGDYLILATPNFAEEPAPTTLFWLPHLHSFNLVALEKMLNKYGYEIAQEHSGYKNNIMVVGKKVPEPRPHCEFVDQSIFHPEEKICNFFLSDQLEPQKRFSLSWTKHRGAYTLMVSPISKWVSIDRVGLAFARVYHYFVSRLFGKFSKKVSIAVSGLEKRITTHQASPIEIQYDDDIQLLIR